MSPIFSSKSTEFKKISSKSFIVLSLESLVQLEITFVYGVKCESIVFYLDDECLNTLAVHPSPTDGIAISYLCQGSTCIASVSWPICLPLCPYPSVLVPVSLAFYEP